MGLSCLVSIKYDLCFEHANLHSLRAWKLFFQVHRTHRSDMNEPSVAPSSSTSRFPLWVIIVIAVLLLCCCCFGALGLLLAFGDAIFYELGLSLLMPGLALL